MRTLCSSSIAAALSLYAGTGCQKHSDGGQLRCSIVFVVTDWGGGKAVARRAGPRPRRPPPWRSCWRPQRRRRSGRTSQKGDPRSGRAAPSACAPSPCRWQSRVSLVAAWVEEVLTRYAGRNPQAPFPSDCRHRRRGLQTTAAGSTSLASRKVRLGHNVSRRAGLPVICIASTVAAAPGHI